MELRGFDSYEISLGDEMRGERASLGKSLEDVERDLRIKAKMILAIEDCNLTGFTNQSVIAGYVRSYARYLGMDVEDCYRRFCEASGYQSPAALMSTSGDGSGFGSLKRQAPVTSRAGTQIGDSRFAAPPSRNRFQARVSLGAVTSGMALIALIGGLSYGGYALLQDLQTLNFEPLPEAPTVVAEAPVIGEPSAAAATVETRPAASDYEGGGALAATPTPIEMAESPRPRRDGPISAIDPTRSSVFVRHAPEPPVAIDVADTSAYASVAAKDEPRADPKAAEVVERGTVLLAAGAAWIKVTERDSSTIWQGTLKPGQEYRLPEQVVAPSIRSGNAGDTYIILDGVAYGPLGAAGSIAKNVSLTPEEVRANLPKADLAAIREELGISDQGAVARAND